MPSSLREFPDFEVPSNFPKGSAEERLFLNGVCKGMLESLTRQLTRRFGEVPDDLDETLYYIRNHRVLGNAFQLACTAATLDEFREQLRHLRIGRPEVFRFDHFVLTVADIPRSVAFYTKMLGMREVTFTVDGETRAALKFGQHKINLHQAGHEFEPKANLPTPGSADLCFITDTPIDTVVAWLKWDGVPILEGPVRRTGATGPLDSVYFRDPDGNLIELANQVAV
jgi:catechol 2,3-dioxygenase-like lactoylglutathione lyase family enzyme